MTKTEDRIANDAAKAAQLIKQTAENTATALNIQYIQKDMAEVKETLKALAANQDGKIEILENKIEAQGKTINLGLGALSALTFIIPFIFHYLFR